MDVRPFVSRTSGQRYATAKEAGEVKQILVDGHRYDIEDLPRRLSLFHDLRDACDDLFEAAQKSML